MDVRVGLRAQVVIPAALRKKMGVEDGDLLHAEWTSAVDSCWRRWTRTRCSGC
jgi:bifunctional DNA-binding transcriptional regulator/antitoxin component of YhaV-PrlF toxin-antitoxin module